MDSLEYSSTLNKKVLHENGRPRAGSSKQIVKKESRGAGDVTNKEYNADSRTITVAPGQAFLGDNRSSSGLGLGDGLTSHTSKWLQVCTINMKGHDRAYFVSQQQNIDDVTHVSYQSTTCSLCMTLAIHMQVDGQYSGNYKSPMEYIHDAPPIKVHGSIVASFGCASISQPYTHLCLRT